MKYYFALPFKDRKGKYQTALDSFIKYFPTIETLS